MAQSNASRVANIATVVLLIVLALAAIAGVIFGVLTHEEPGIDPRAVPWPRDRFPLTVCASSYLDTSEDHLEAFSAVDEAVEVTNERLGFHALESSRGDASCEIRVTVGVPAEPGWMDPGGDASFGHGPSCDIRTSNTGTSEILHLVLQHELGHCLGLAHDDWEGSIMRRVQTETPDREFPPRITDTDRETLRALYAPPG